MSFDKAFCIDCREPIQFDGYDWYHERTGYYYGYGSDDPKRGELQHVALPGGRKTEKKVKSHGGN